MATVFVLFSKPFMMPAGGMAMPGEIMSLDPATAAALIANGIAVASGAPSAPSAPAITRVQFTGKTGSVRIGHSPIFHPGEVAGFPSAIAAALIASGAAVAN